MAETPRTTLPPEVVSRLRDLQLELEEGDITQKGYEKKKARILAPFKPEKQPPPVARKFSPGLSPRQSPRQGYDHGFSVGLRQEAIQLALAQKQARGESGAPAPTKRQSFLTKRQAETVDNHRPSSSYNTPTHFTDTPVGSTEDLQRGITPPATSSVPSLKGSREEIRQNEKKSRDRSKSMSSGQQCVEEWPGLVPLPLDGLAPPDVTQGESNFGWNTRRSVHMSSVRVKADDVMNGGGGGRVSAKIQQLLNTLKRPKKKPLEQFFVDENDHIEATKADPDAPRPEGAPSKSAVGENIYIPDHLPHTFTEALRKYGSSHKAPSVSVVDVHGKILYTLLYAKLLSRSNKISYALLHKVGNHRDGTSLMQGDRVALMYSSDDPVGFISAFYGCLIAGIVPVAIDPPVSKEDAGLQQIGFLLGSCSVSWVLTSESCLKNLPRDDLGHPVQFRGWPRLHFFITENLHRPPKEWQPPLLGKDRTVKVPAYVEYTADRDGSALGAVVSRETMICHCQRITQACKYNEGEVMISVLDYKRSVGLWHSMCASVLNGIHVIFVPPSVMLQNPAMWLLMATRHKASSCLVTSKDLHWSLHASRDYRDINLQTIRMLLLADRANPWSLSACDSFMNAFETRGLKPNSLCPCAYSPESLTIAIRRPGRPGSGGGRGVLSLTGLSYGVVRVDKEGSLTALTLQDCGTVTPGARVAVVKIDGTPEVCKVDEVGELCLCSNSIGDGYYGLHGKTAAVFKVHPLGADGNQTEESYVRTGLLGFLGPEGLVFVSGTTDGLISLHGRRHNADDLKATVLAVDPIKFVHKGRIAVFSVPVLKEERIIVVAEQKTNCMEEESFQWMSHVLPAVDSVHAVGIYCLCLIAPGGLPRSSNGLVDVSETKHRFLEGSLHPVNVLMCPHSTVTNLPKPRQKYSEPGPAAALVGNLVKGTRIAQAQGREIAEIDDGSDLARKYQLLSEILKWRAHSTPDHNLYTLLNSKGHIAGNMTCTNLQKKAERFSYLCIEQSKLNSGDHVALLYPPGLELIVAVFGCLYVGLIPVPVRPPNPHNVTTTLPTVKMIVHVSKSVAILSSTNLLKLLKSKEAQSVIDPRSWPPMIATDDLPKKKLISSYRAPTPEMISYLDFSVSTTGMLAGVKMSHAAVTSLCRAQKLACELYPSRDIAVCLDPYCGMGFVLWCLSSVYSGHHTILIPPVELETCPSLWLQAVSQYKVRDTFCSYPVMELCTKHLAQHIPTLKVKGINLSSLRTCIAVAEERPRISLTQTFCALFCSLGLSAKAVSTSFGCRVNIAICMQEASHPEASSVYIDTRALRHDRIAQVERGSPNSLCVMESGRILPGVLVVIANPETRGQCGDSSLGEIWVSSTHNGSGYFNVNDDDRLTEEHFRATLATGDGNIEFARTSYLGFIKRTELTQTDGAPHDALFVVGSLDEALLLRGLRYHPIDLENSVIRCHKGISECAVFTWTNLLVVVVELDADEKEALNVVPLVTNVVLEEHQVIVGVVVVVDPAVIPLNSRGEKQRMHLRDSFLADQLDPIYVAYNM